MAGRKSPWGGKDGGSDEPVVPNSDGGGDGTSDSPAAGDPPSPPPPAPDGPRNPWLPPASDAPPRRSASMEDILRARVRGGGSGGGGGGRGFPRLPQRPDGKSWTGIIAGAAVLLWLGLSTTHMLGPKEQGVVTLFGKYSRTIGSGVSLTLPWPFEQVDSEDVSIRLVSIPQGEAEKLMLTSDQNLVDTSYIVRWNIKDLKQYKFQLDDPDDTVVEVAEAAMRAAVAEFPLKDVMGGSGRAQIEQAVRRHMQAVLDAYRSGINIQGIEIKKTDAPEKVVEAFQSVTAAQQGAQRAVANARAWAQQVLNQAQGNAAEFDKVYEQYKLSPDVTRRRLYYETMERVLSSNDKVIVEAPGVTSYLPLPEVKRASPAPQEGGQ